MSRKFKTSLSEERLPLNDQPVEPARYNGLSQSFTGDTDMSQLIRMRKKRRLPPILLRRRPNHQRNFWPTYRGAVEWLRKREADLNIALGLLELYPNLIQEAPLDGLWEFLRPLLSQLPFHQTVAKNNGFLQSNPVIEVSRDENKSGLQTVPSISVTSPAGHPARSPNQPDTDHLVYICGKNKPLINVLSQQINPFFFTKVDFESVTKIDKSADILRSKLFVFVMCKDAIEDLATVRKLRAAHAHATPVLYVREEEFSLPTPLPDFLFNKSPDEEADFTRENSGLLIRARSVSPSVPNLRPGGQPDKRHHIRTPLSKSGPRAQSGRLRKTSTDRKNVNAGIQIMDGYRSALIYANDHPQAFTKSLHKRLSELLGEKFVPPEPSMTQTTSPSVNSPPGDQKSVFHLRVPGSRSSLSGDDDGIALSEYGSYDEGLDQVFDDDLDNIDEWAIPEIDSGLSSPLEKETTYMVYPSAESCSSSDGPRMVRWPPKPEDSFQETREVDAFNPFFDSPLGFEDVQLDVVLDSSSPL